MESARGLGCDVFGAHRNNWPEQAEQLQGDIKASGCRSEFFVGDVGTIEGVEAAADALARVAPKNSVRLMVHCIANASLGNFMPGGEGVFRQFKPKNFSKTMDSMANSFPWWAQALVARDLLAPGARILGMTNPIGDSLLVNFGLITAAKAALELYAKHLALEMGAMGYRVNILKFGLVETDAAAMGFGERWEHFRRLTKACLPPNRILTAEEVGKVVVHLCKEEADWFNGAVIDYTGGQMNNLLEATLRLGEPPRD